MRVRYITHAPPLEYGQIYEVVGQNATYYSLAGHPGVVYVRTAFEEARKPHKSPLCGCSGCKSFEITGELE